MGSVKKSSFVENMFRTMTTNFWVALVGFISSFVFPKILSIESYALYHTFTLYIGYIAILHLGFPSGMVVKYAGHEFDAIEKSQYKSELKIVTSILAFFTAIFVGMAVYIRNGMVLFIALSIFPVCVTNSYRALLQSWLDFRLYSIISNWLATLVPILAIAWYIIRGDLQGEIYVIIYIVVYWLAALWVIKRNLLHVNGISSKAVFSSENFRTEKTGLALVLGNYINTLFVSVDKQFVKIFFGTKEFAFYSFGMSMQALMIVFISSVAQPLFPAMAQNKFPDEQYNKMKSLLLIFGSFSGCAYFATSFIVNNFIQKYKGSLDIVGIYFIIFPALAVITCLYINLYKIKGLMKKYIITLVLVLIIAICLNMFFAGFVGDYTGIAIATTITYYLWFFVGFFQFDFLKIQLSDLLYLILYIFGFVIITNSFGDIFGCCVYFLYIIIIAFIIYKDIIKEYFGRFFVRGENSLFIVKRLLNYPLVRKIVKKIILSSEGGEKESSTLRAYMKDKYNVLIGLYSYGGCFDYNFNIGEKYVEIGRYCSFASDIRCFGANHPIDHAVMSAYFYNKKWGGLDVEDVPRGHLCIGNDVWIGYGVIITSSCHNIGNGAVIGAGAVVTKDVPAYGIVVGTPGRLVGFRFDEETINLVEKSEWWLMSPKELMKYYHLIKKPKEWAKEIIIDKSNYDNMQQSEKTQN